MIHAETQFLSLSKILDKRGNLSFFEHPGQLPFKIARTYWIYDVPSGEVRGSHAFKMQQEFIIALSGSFDVVLNDSENKYKFLLNRSYQGLYIPKMFWRSLEKFFTNAIALIVSDRSYDADDYIRDFEQFKSLKNG